MSTFPPNSPCRLALPIKLSQLCWKLKIFDFETSACRGISERKALPTTRVCQNQRFQTHSLRKRYVYTQLNRQVVRKQSRKFRSHRPRNERIEPELWMRRFQSYPPQRKPVYKAAKNHRVRRNPARRKHVYTQLEVDQRQRHSKPLIAKLDGRKGKTLQRPFFSEFSTPKTPNTPFSAQEYGITSETAKQVVKSGSRFDSLMELLVYWGNIILTRGSVPVLSELGEAIEELGRLLVVSLICRCQTNFHLVQGQN